ncbi:hypothetical protein C5167_043803 [Papaver somniferum]|uniref:S1 motif domain-containing protein n=1 Tax=Papaver somniferum TaxID=3469 RepID=A0A4Y7LAC8_PAPSO|nr:hypothetical protein C5167_043803 [Papaver somniferum]
MVMEVEKEKEEVMVTPGEVLGYSSTLIPGKGAYLHNKTIYASLTGRRVIIPPSSDSPDQKRSIVEVTGHKAHGAVPEPGSIVIARVTKVMAKMASADIMCVGTKSVKEKFSGVIRKYVDRQQDVRATEIDKVDMHLSFRHGDIVKALVVSFISDAFSSDALGDILSLGDARAYYLSTAKNELGVVSAESIGGATMVPISYTEMQCPLTGQIEQRKVAKV